MPPSFSACSPASIPTTRPLPPARANRKLTTRNIAIRADSKALASASPENILASMMPSMPSWSSSLDVMRKQGATLIDPADIETFGKFDDSELVVFLYELKAGLNAYLARLGPGAPVRTLKDIIEFNERNREKEMPYFGQDLFIKSEAKGPLTEKEYLDALSKNHQLARTDGIDALMDKHQLDAIVAPTGGPAWITDLINGDHVAGGSSNAAAVAGYPNINVTAGFISGLPVGISFFGRAWSEPTLIKIAYAFEQFTNARQKPRFLSTIDTRAGS